VADPDLKSYIDSIPKFIPDSLPESSLKSAINSFEESYYEIKDFLNFNETILDVGCGGGFLVNYLSSLGYKVYGFDKYQYDSHTKLINFTINNTEIVRDCSIKDYYPHDKFDLIFLHNVVEHLEDWEESLHKLNSLLKPNGKIILILPNYSFPIEPHFMIPIFFNKKITYSIFKNRIRNLENKHKRIGLWVSLNFIKPKDIKKFYKFKNFKVCIDREYFPKFVSRKITNLNKVSVHSGNPIHRFSIFLSKFIVNTKIINIWKFSPLSFHPFVKIVMIKSISHEAKE